MRMSKTLEPEPRFADLSSRGASRIWRARETARRRESWGDTERETEEEDGRRTDRAGRFFVHMLQTLGLELVLSEWLHGALNLSPRCSPHHFLLTRPLSSPLSLAVALLCGTEISTMAHVQPSTFAGSSSCDFCKTAPATVLVNG